MRLNIRKRMRLSLRKLAGHGGLRQRFIHRAWNTYEHMVFEYHTKRNVRATDTVAPLYPRRLYWIDPQSVTHYIPDGHFDMLQDTGRVVGGDWDVNTNYSVEDLSVYKSFVEHFENNVRWEETDGYQRQVEKIRDGTSARYPTVGDLDRKYALYDRLYEKFSVGEYLTQEEIASQRLETTGGDGGHAFFPRLTKSSIIRHEITVNVGRDGTMFLDDGRHRLLIARIAELETVPVRIVVRHTLWQQTRDRVARSVQDSQFEAEPDNGQFLTSSSAVDIDHPDIQTLLN